MRQFRVGHCCNFCGQEIMYLLPDSSTEPFGLLFQERTFLELRSAETRDPSRQVTEYWYCSDYCARDDLNLSIDQREEQMRQGVAWLSAPAFFSQRMNGDDPRT
jgi:hypothetical protein